MSVFLTSLLMTHVYDGNGNRSPIPFGNINGILDNIVARLPHNKRLVIVANDPNDHDDNDKKLQATVKSLSMKNVEFDQATVLDGRNMRDAAQIILGASLVILSGGKCLCQIEFFNAIGLKDLIARHDGVIIGVSAGSMNLGKTVANFPEEKSDLPEPRWFDGLGIFDGIVIPHFDGENKKYQFDCDDFDIADEYILPMSDAHEFIGLPNNAYIVMENDGTGLKYYGKVYKISDRKVTELH